MRRRPIQTAAAMLVLSGLALAGCNLGEAIGGALTEVCETEIYTVTKFEDTDDGICTADDCSLREAVLTANACEGDHTIRVPEGTYNLTRLGAGEADGHRGDLNIRRPVTIEAVGGEVIIDGQNADRVFDVQFSGGVTGVVTLDGLTIQNGAASTRGGGLHQQFAEVHIPSGVFRANTAGMAGTSGGAGGAIYTNGIMTLGDVEIRNNTAYGEGGGIFVNTNGELTTSDALTVVDNHARDNYGGGGIFNRGTALVSGEIRANTAEWSGGGINNQGELVVREAQVNNNSSMMFGGGIVTTRSMELRDSVVQGNRAEFGGGLHISPAPRMPEPVVRVSGTILEINDVTEQGGGIFNSGGARLAISGSWIRNNRAQYGAGILNRGDLVVSSSTLSRNQASHTVGGGGLFNDLYGTSDLTNVTLSGNSAPNGAAITNGGLSRAQIVILRYSTVAENTGNAIFAVEGVETVLDNTILANNSAENCRGEQPATLGGNVEDANTCGLGGSATINDVINTDPLLQALADNGGFGWTHALAAGSPAIDNAYDGRFPCPGADQRGVARPQGAACDAGAYEFESEEGAGASPAGPTATPSTEVAVPESPIEINFNADLYSLPLGECTRLRWAVENADLVALDGQQVPATEAEQVCPLGTTTYQLTASNASESAEAFVTIEVLEPIVEPPSAPGQLGASEQQCDGNSYVVSIQWVDTADNEDGYSVYRDGNLLATLGANANQYTDNNAPATGFAVTYGVEAFNDAGASSRPTTQEDGCLF